MISMRLPRTIGIEAMLNEMSNVAFSYADVGATRHQIPNGYNVDRASGVIGQGDLAFERAKQAILAWTPFDLPWIRVFPQSEPVVDALVAVAGRVAGFWWTNVCRVVYTIDEPHRFGFAYGTLPQHAETGEELFVVEQSPDTGEIDYEILVFSKPRHPLARIGYPFARATQHRFRMGSIGAMRRAASTSLR